MAGALKIVTNSNARSSPITVRSCHPVVCLSHGDWISYPDFPLGCLAAHADLPYSQHAHGCLATDHASVCQMAKKKAAQVVTQNRWCVKNN
jgi:hypothetical protein